MDTNHVFSNAHAHFLADPNSDSHAYFNTHSYTYAHRNSNSDSYAYRNAGAYPSNSELLRLTRKVQWN